MSTPSAPTPSAVTDEQMKRLFGPVITLIYDKSDDGTFYARMQVSGLKSEQQAQAAMDHMQRLFCGQEQEPTQ